MTVQKILHCGCRSNGFRDSPDSHPGRLSSKFLMIWEARLLKAKESIAKRLARQVEKGKLSNEEKEITLARLTTSIDLNDAGDADLVIEAVVEDETVKGEIFKSWTDL